MSIGENIRALRERSGISQAQLADKAGISQPMLCQIERGTKNPSLQVGKEIACALNVSIETLLA